MTKVCYSASLCENKKNNSHQSNSECVVSFYFQSIGIIKATGDRKPSSGSHDRHHFVHSYDLHHPFEVVRQNIQTHFRADML